MNYVTFVKRLRFRHVTTDIRRQTSFLETAFTFCLLIGTRFPFSVATAKARVLLVFPDRRRSQLTALLVESQQLKTTQRGKKKTTPNFISLISKRRLKHT